jgi:hypothetical protein
MYQTRVIANESQVPEGYVRLKELAEKYSDNDRKKLSEAHNNGHVRAVKIMRTVNDRTGATYVHEGDADAFLTGKMKRDVKPDKADANQALVVELRRIADAQEKTVEILGRLEAIWKSA